MIQAQLKINGKQSCLAMGLTTSVTIKSPTNPRPLNDYYIITWYYMLHCGNSCRFHSQFVRPNRKRQSRKLRDTDVLLHHSYSQSHIKFNQSCVLGSSSRIDSNVSGISSRCWGWSFFFFFKSPCWQLQSHRLGNQVAAPTVFSQVCWGHLWRCCSL